MTARDSRGVALDVSRLVELDLAFLGPRVIVGEFAVGVVGCLVLGDLSLSHAIRTHSPLWSWPVLLGVELAAIGINYVPLLIEAWRRRSDTNAIAATKAALRDNPGEARSYSWRQAWILVPGAVVLFALSSHRDQSRRSSMSAL